MSHFLQVIPRLPVADLRRTLQFYAGVLGFCEDVLWPEARPTFAVVKRDETSLGFFEPTEQQVGPIGYVELYLHVSNAQELHDAIKAHVSIEWGPEVYAYGRREFALRDPDRYLVIFTEATDDPPTTSEPEA